MSFTLPLHTFGEAGRDYGVRLAEFTFGETGRANGVILAGYTFGETGRDYGVRLPSITFAETDGRVINFTLPGYTFGETGRLTGVQLPIYEFTESLPPNGLIGASLPFTVQPWFTDELVSGTISASTPMMDSDVTAILAPWGTITATATVITSSLVGGSHYIDASVPKLSATLAGYLTTPGVMAPRLTVVAATMVGERTLAGEIRTATTRLRGTLTGDAARVGTVVTSLRKPMPALTGWVSRVGLIEVSVPALRPALTGYLSVTGSVTARVPALTATLIPGLAGSYVDTLVLNTSAPALTKYTNYQFNSFAVQGDVAFAAKTDGIYQLDNADVDPNAANIAAEFTSALIDYDAPGLKRTEAIYFSGRINGSLEFDVSTEAELTYTYTLSDDGVDTLRQRRLHSGKGLRGRYWKITVRNVEGASFVMDDMSIDYALTQRRIGV